MSKVSAVAVLALIFAASISGTRAVAEGKNSKPTGACTITVYGVSPTCTSPITQESCNAVAKKVGGTAKWEEGKSCPK
jgi:hypothetical protein